MKNGSLLHEEVAVRLIGAALPLTILSILAVGCTAVMPTPAASVTASGIAKGSPTPTAPPAETLIQSPHPSRQPTASLTPVPVSPLSDQERLARVLGLLSANGGCELPCFWGITPGESSWNSTEALLHGMGVKTSSKLSQAGGVLHGAGGLEFPERGVSIYMNIWERSGLVERISILAHPSHSPEALRTDWHWYMMGPVLSRLGLPSDISFVAEPPREHEANAFYVIALGYEGHGLSIFYSGSTDDRPLFEICPGASIWEVQLDVRSPTYVTPTPETTPTATEPPRGYALPLPIEEVTGLSLEEFVKQFAGQDNSACFTSPRELWQ